MSRPIVLLALIGPYGAASPGGAAALPDRFVASFAVALHHVCIRAMGRGVWVRASMRPGHRLPWGGSRGKRALVGGRVLDRSTAREPSREIELTTTDTLPLDRTPWGIPLRSPYMGAVRAAAAQPRAVAPWQLGLWFSCSTPAGCVGRIDLQRRTAGRSAI